MANFNLRVNFPFIFSIICFCGFLYQFFDLYFEYMSGKTVVNIKVETILNQTLPAITICLPSFYIPDNINVNESINKELQNNFMNLTKAHHMLYFGKELDGDINDVYRKINDKLNVLLSNISMLDFFEKVTSQVLLKATRDRLPFSIAARIEGIYSEKIDDDMIFKKEKRKENLIFTNTIESIMSIDLSTIINLRKCFTYFSHLQKQWRDFKINLKSITFRFLDLSKLLDHATHYELAIHSQNSLPNHNEFIKLEYKFINIHYSEVQTQLLGSGFDTNCFDYDLDHKFANYNMRSDCITSCMKPSENPRILIPHRLSRKNYYQNRRDIKFLDTQMNKGFPKQDELNCLLNCKKDCWFTHFIHNTEVKEKIRDPLSLLKIFHSSYPDILITHLPEITFNAFVCNFGGLLGLWLGLSVFAIFSEFRDICIKLFEKKQQFMNNCQNFTANVTINYKRKLFKKPRQIK